MLKDIAVAYQHQDDYRLENIPEYLDVVKKGLEESRIKALSQIEQTLLRIHNTYAIAWDFGGVLMDGHNKLFVELYARSKGVDLSTEQLTRLWQIIFKGDPIPGVNYDALKIGQATPEQFAGHAIKHFNTELAAAGKALIEITNQEIRSFLTLYYSHYDPKHENRETLQRLEQLGIRQYGLTNNFMAKVEYFLEQHEFDYLQELLPIVSEKFGVSKPDPKLYLLFKQHVFLDQFAKTVLQIDLPNQAVTQLWQAIFQETVETDNFVAYEQGQINLERLSQHAIAQCNQVLKEFGYATVDVTSFAGKWSDFWVNQYDHIGKQTIFVDDKIKNLNQAFKHEGILGVHYDANQGQTLAAQPVLRELLEQERLKQVVQTLRELTAVDAPLGQRAEQALERLMPFRVRHEKLIWQAQTKKHQKITDTVTNKQISDLLQQHYQQLYTTHFKLGQLVSYQYELIHRLAVLPESTYDEARQIVLKLFETSDLFLDQNRDLYPWQETEIPENVATNLSDTQESESILKRSLLPEIKHKIVEYVDVLEVSRQPIIQALMRLLQTQVNDLETLKQFMNQLLQQLIALQSVRVVPWQQIERSFQQLRQSLAGMELLLSFQATQSYLSDRLEEWYHQLEADAQRASMDLMPLERMVAEWEQEIHQLESTYFQQYHQWKILKDQEKVALYQAALLDQVREQFSAEDLYQLIRGLMLRVYDLPKWKDLTKPTIILISGATGSGKSTLSTQLAQVLGIQKSFSTDEAGRANAKAMLDFLFGEEAANAFPALYQSSFEGSVQLYYSQSILTMIGVEGLIQRLSKQNTSALIEGVGLMPGLLSEAVFERLNLDWLIVQVDPQRHWQHFNLRSQSAAQRGAKRYQDNFEMIRQIHDRIVSMGLTHGLTIVENQGSIQQAVHLATEQIKSPLADQFFQVSDRIRDEMHQLLAKQRQHLPVQVRFDVKRAVLDLGIGESTITELLHRFGFEPVPGRRHQWIRQPLRDVQLI